MDSTTQPAVKKSKRTSQSFALGAMIMAVGMIIVKIAGAAFKVPLAYILGGVGSGYFNIAYNLYNPLYALATAGLPIAISRMVAKDVANNRFKDVKMIHKISVPIFVTTGLIGMLLMFLGAQACVNFTNSPGALYSIIVLAPTVFFSCLISIYKGYYEGLRNMIPTAVSQVLEQIINAVISIVAAFLLFDMGARVDIAKGTDIYADAYGAAGGTLGTAAGALTALIFCFVLFRMYRRILKRQMRRDNTVMLESYGNIARVLVATIVPVIISGTVYNVSNLVDNSIYGFYMKSVGESAHYMAKWGVYSGQYYLLINVPIAISNALSSSMLPSLTRTVTEGNKGEVLRKINMTIRFSMIVAIPSAVGLTLLGAPIVEMLFNQDTKLGGDLLFLGSLAVIFFSLSTVTNGILQGINKMKTPVRNALISLILHVGILVALLYGLKTGIYGVVIANMLFGLSMCILNGISIANYLNYRQEVKKTFVLPFLASLIMGGCSYLVYYLLNMLTKRNSIACLAAVIVAVAVYFVMLIVFRCVDEKELHSMPMGGKMVWIAKKLRLM